MRHPNQTEHEFDGDLYTHFACRLPISVCSFSGISSPGWSRQEPVKHRDMPCAGAGRGLEFNDDGPRIVGETLDQVQISRAAPAPVKISVEDDLYSQDNGAVNTRSVSVWYPVITAGNDMITTASIIRSKVQCFTGRVPADFKSPFSKVLFPFINGHPNLMARPVISSSYHDVRRQAYSGDTVLLPSQIYGQTISAGYRRTAWLHSHLCSWNRIS